MNTILSCLFKGGTVQVAVTSGGVMNLRLQDGYWIGLLDPRYEYEPEIAAALTRVLGPSVYFIDCGANLGYWTIMAHRRARKSIAVEPNPFTFALLTQNLALNQISDGVWNRAAWSSDEQTLDLRVHHNRHAASTLRTGDIDKPDSDGWTNVEVKTVTLGRLIKEECADASAPIVLKLDAEGAEIPAVEGGLDALRSRDVTILYEDHGKDLTHSVTRCLIAVGMEVVDPLTMRSLTIADLDNFKREPGRGYNFLARWPSGHTA